MADSRAERACAQPGAPLQGRREGTTGAVWHSDRGRLTGAICVRRMSRGAEALGGTWRQSCLAKPPMGPRWPRCPTVRGRVRRGWRAGGWQPSWGGTDPERGGRRAPRQGFAWHALALARTETGPCRWLWPGGTRDCGPRSASRRQGAASAAEWTPWAGIRCWRQALPGGTGRRTSTTQANGSLWLCRRDRSSGGATKGVLTAGPGAPRRLCRGEAASEAACHGA